MVKTLLILTVALTMLGAAPDQGRRTSNARHDLVGRHFDAHVVRVVDGDTLQVLPSGAADAIRIRLEGIDAPEQGDVFSREATTFLRTLVFDQQVRVDGRDIDRYDRLVARVSSAGQDVSIALVRTGLACHSYVSDPALAREEAAARAAGKGFWAPAAPRPQCVTSTAFSARSSQVPQSAVAASQFRANVSSGVYHASTCRNFRCRNCTRVFATEAEAQAAGFRPAGDCLKH